MAFFGFKDVEDFVKTKSVQDLFERVTNSYDLMNNVMSGGIHHMWKNHFIRSLDLNPGETILDMASGTGDIAEGIIKEHGFLNPSVIAMDLTESMLLSGKHRAIDKGIIKGIVYVLGDAEKIPLQDESVDVYTCAYGLRNVGNLDNALKEAYRVLKKGGRFYCLEFSAFKNAYLEPFYDFYSFQCIPLFGKYIAKDEAAYQYLVESIRRFPDQETFVQKIKEAGFQGVVYENLSCGMTAIHRCEKE